MYQTFVAVGDSFTEGLDDRRTDGSYRGWADLVARELAEQVSGFRYANLAVRGRRLRSIRDEQVPLAEAMAPSLLTVSAGGNDIIGFRCDVPALAQSMHEVLERLVGTAGTVVVFTGFDPRGRLPMSRLLATRAATYNASVRSSAELLGARVVDLWTMPRLCEPRMWASDRLHLSTDGHGLVADAVLDLLGDIADVGLGAAGARAPVIGGCPSLGCPLGGQLLRALGGPQAAWPLDGRLPGPQAARAHGNPRPSQRAPHRWHGRRSPGGQRTE